MTAANALLLSMLMIAGFILAAGGIYVMTRRRDRKRGTLMIVAALVMWGNVAIMTL